MTTIYHCVNKRCAAYHHEVTALAPAEGRRLTGRSVSCGRCGQVLQYVRTEPNGGPLTYTVADLAPEQAAAIVAYAKREGPRWKAALNAAWERSVEPGALQQIRNAFGPSWLTRFRLPSGEQPPTFTSADGSTRCSACHLHPDLCSCRPRFAAPAGTGR